MKRRRDEHSASMNQLRVRPRNGWQQGKWLAQHVLKGVSARCLDLFRG